MTDAKIDINRADMETLAALPGLGETKAQRIIEFRENIQPFEAVIELTAVRGISERMVREFEHLVTVEATVPSHTQLMVVDDEAEAETAAIGDEAGEPAADESEPETADPDADTAPLPILPVTAESDDEVVVTPLGTAVAADEESDEETAVPEPEPTRQPAAPVMPAYDPQAARKRGQRAALFGALGGAIGGVLLTLLILFLLNNSLSYGPQTRDLQQQIIYAQATQSALDRELDALATALGGDIGTLSERLDTADSRLDQTNTNLTSLDGQLSAAQSDIGTLYDTSEQLDERLTGVAAAADTFNTFLDGLRDLLFDLQGPPPVITPTVTITATVPLTGTATPTVTPTPDADNDVDENDDAEAEPTATPTANGDPTRTPRPTFTPISTATATPTTTPTP
jgi:competence ComEA-like helix-hairpin-helix protein